MRRWYVYKDSEDKAWRWVAIPIHENWWEKPQGRRFPQWYMAMAYANRMAQKSPNAITIKDHSGEFCDLTAINKRSYINLKAGGSTFNLAPHEWKPLARFLLTEAYRPEET